MPEHTSWWNLLPFYQALLAWVRAQLGLTWAAKAPIEIGHVLSYVFVAILVLLVGLSVRRKVRDTSRSLVPDEGFTFRNFIEVFTEVLLGLMESIMGREAAVYFLPLIGTAGLLILGSNLLGLIPGFVPPTSNLNTTVAMAITIFVTTHIFGLRKHGIRYFKHFLGPIIKWYALPLMVFMFAIEVVSHCTRPVSLSVRLMGNMFADHMLVGIFLMLGPILLPLPFMFLGLLVCVLQTLVFCLLSVIYIGMAIEPQEH